MIRAFCDGASFLNKGGCGVVLYVDQDMVDTISEPVAPATNNVAEIRAVIFALDYALTNNRDELEVFTDSMLAVNLINGKWLCHKEHLKPLVLDAKKKAASLHFFSISHIYREYNEEADHLSKLALNRILTESEVNQQSLFEAKIQWVRQKKKKGKKRKSEKSISPRGVIRGVEKKASQEKKIVLRKRGGITTKLETVVGDVNCHHDDKK